MGTPELREDVLVQGRRLRPQVLLAVTWGLVLRVLGLEFRAEVILSNNRFQRRLLCKEFIFEGFWSRDVGLLRGLLLFGAYAGRTAIHANLHTNPEIVHTHMHTSYIYIDIYDICIYIYIHRL